MADKILQLAAFQLKPDFAARLMLDVCGIDFPRAWIGQLNQLQAEVNGRPNQKNRFAVATLNSSLNTFVAYLAALPNASIEKASTPWLLTRQKFPVEQIWQVFQAWLKQNYRTCPSYDHIRATMSRTDLGDWQAQKSNLFETPATHSNNTASLNKVAFTALPVLIADELIQRKVKLTVFGQALTLVRIPTVQGAELITDTPILIQDEKGVAYYSYIVNITVQTIVGESQPRIYFHYGVRRWVSQPLLTDEKLNLDGTSHTAYIYRTKEWLGTKATQVLTVASFRAIRDEEGKRKPIWEDAIPAIAESLQIKLPSIAEVLKDPVRWLTGDAETGVAIAIPEKTPRNRLVGVGLPLEEHEQITETLAEVLSDQLDLVALPERLPTRKRVFTAPNCFPNIEELRDLTVEERKAALVWSVGSKITLEVLYTRPEFRDRMVERIKSWLFEERPALLREAENDEADETNNQIELTEIFDLSDDEEEEVIQPKKRSKPKRKAPPETPPIALEHEVIPLNADGASLTIITRFMPEFGGVLDEPTKTGMNKRERGQYRRQASEQRITQIIQTENKAVEPTLCFIELSNYRNNPKLRATSGLRDPKLAIRRGLAACDKLTKFIDADMDKPKLIERCDGATKDALRMLGFLPAPIKFELRKETKLPPDLHVAGLWQIRLTAKRAFTKVYLPVVVIVSADVPQPVQAWLPDGRGLRPYYRAMLDITLLSDKLVTRDSQADMRKQLYNLLQHSIPQEGIQNLVLLTVLQNIRDLWASFNDKEAQRDVLPLDNSTELPLASLPYQLRIIRLRTNTNRETPEWYTKGAEPGKGYTKGVWQLPGAERIFYNIAAKPFTQSGKRSGKQIKPSESYAVPSILEIALLGLQPEDKPAFWARAIDYWRRMHYSFTDMTLFPLPLHWAKKMSKYAEVISPFILPDTWDDEADLEKDDEEELENNDFDDLSE